MSRFRMASQRSSVLVVDLQDKLLPVIAESEAIAARTSVLLRGASVLDVPVVVTEQNPSRLGDTESSVAQAWPEGTPVFEKMRFSAWVEPVRDRIMASERDTVLLCGVEAHVCVLQTALDLLEAGFHVVLLADAVGSRRPLDCATALRRMEKAGVILSTVESALLEMTVGADSPAFKKLLPWIK